jgi:hypothetical protein
VKEFRNNASGQQESAGVYCLEVGEHRDPSDQFMRRFDGYKPPVRKASECSIHGFEGVVTDIRTGKTGLILKVDDIKWLSDTEVEVWGGYYEGNLGASGDSYKVVKQRGKWQVVDHKIHSIS